MLRRSQGIEQILDECLIGIEESGWTVDECLARYSQHADELRPLLMLSLRLRSARQLQPSSEFRAHAGLRMQNLLAANPRSCPAPRRRLSFSPVRFVFSTVAMVLILSSLIGAGTVCAAREALPGDSLYIVKRTFEDVQVAVAPGEYSRATLRISLAARRLDEASALLERSRTADLSYAVSEYAAEMQAARSYFSSDSQLSTADQARLASDVAAAATTHETRLAGILARAPEPMKPAVTKAMDELQGVRDGAIRSLPPASPTLAPATATASVTPSPMPSPTLARGEPPERRPAATPLPAAAPTGAPNSTVQPGRPRPPASGATPAGPRPSGIPDELLPTIAAAATRTMGTPRPWLTPHTPPTPTPAPGAGTAAVASTAQATAAATGAPPSPFTPRPPLATPPATALPPTGQPPEPTPVAPAVDATPAPPPPPPPSGPTSEPSPHDGGNGAGTTGVGQPGAGPQPPARPGGGRRP